jgi:phosphatidylserine/phosphatidylglycerophosphate/cardiolipin synthase-like enzyme
LDLRLYDDAVVIEGKSSPDIPVYFAPGFRISEGLCSFISSAESTLDVCIYDLDLLAVSDTLIEAKKRGVSVNIVTDSDNRKLLAMDRLSKAGIRIVSDHKPSIMHHKFVIADAKRIWTGSFNFTENGQNRNDNNALILESPEIAACYLNKFQEYMSGKFSTEAKERTYRGKAFMGKIPVEAAFSPSDQVADLICRQLSYAKQSVRVMAFVLTSERIAEQLGELAKKGISVECLLDRGQARTRYSQDQYLLGCGVKIHISPNSRGKMHHKVIVIDEETVITGSYNFSENAENGNDENLIIVKNEELGKLFSKEFTRCLNGTKGY